jgi:hypothetical protein
MNYIKKTSRFSASNLINLEELDIVLFKSCLLALHSLVLIQWKCRYLQVTCIDLVAALFKPSLFTVIFPHKQIIVTVGKTN